jgi:hypothetical protein
VSALLVAIGSLMVLSQQLFGNTSSTAKTPSPQVALTKVPGGGVLMVTGTF